MEVHRDVLLHHFLYILQLLIITNITQRRAYADAEARRNYIANRFPTLALEGVGDQHHAPATLRAENPITDCKGGGFGFDFGIDVHIKPPIPGFDPVPSHYNKYAFPAARKCTMPGNIWSCFGFQ
jgi:hypothetical protein